MNVIIHWAKVDAGTGQIVSMGGTANTQELLEMEEPGFDIFMNRPKDVWSHSHYYDYSTTSWVTRPELLEPSNNYDMTMVPTGSVVRVENEAGDSVQVLDEESFIELTDPGVYRFSIDPPFPWKSIYRFEVVV